MTEKKRRHEGIGVKALVAADEAFIWTVVRAALQEVPVAARIDLADWIGKWQANYPRRVAWVEDSIDDTLSFYRPPPRPHKHLKSAIMLKRPKPCLWITLACCPQAQPQPQPRPSC